jgi:threonine synthase
MKFISTRDIKGDTRVSPAFAIKQGLAPDGGLYVPEYIPTIDKDFVTALIDLSYPEKAEKILSLFLDDFTSEELLEYANAAYVNGSFPAEVAPLVSLNNGLSVLELWHGPTAAFKDFALCIMPYLLTASLRKLGEARTAMILVATSGDTGKAALEGYKDVKGVKIKVFYPVDGVSKVQKLQMVTQAGSNVDVCAIKGNFDDAQTGVKKIFSDEKIGEELNAKGYFLSSANSINWGRLAPQIVYYFAAYCELLSRRTISYGDKVDFCVPTGNFGNILAGYIAKKMGLPIGKLICASNSNNILTDFLATGVYDRNREFHTTISPSMDILISSNLERLLYFVAGSGTVVNCMKSLSDNGAYKIPEDILQVINNDFCGYFANEASTCEAISNTYDTYSYLADPHTGVGLYCADNYAIESQTANHTVVLSTASPFKFASSVYKALTNCIPPDGYEALTALSDLTSEPITTPLAELDKRTVRFSRVCSPEDMSEDLFEHLED